MIASSDKNDAELETDLGSPMPKDELLRLADINAQDVSRALNRFSEAVPPRFKRLLD